MSDLRTYNYSHFCLAGYNITTAENTIELDADGVGGGVGYVDVSITAGTYSDIRALLQELEDQLNVVEAGYTVELNADGKVQISHADNFFLKEKSGDGLLDLLGFTEATYTSGNSYTAENYCVLHWIPDSGLHPESNIVKWERTGFTAKSDSGEYIQQVSSNYHTSRKTIFKNISADNFDWFVEFWFKYADCDGIRLYENYTDSTPEFYLLDKDSLTKPMISYGSVSLNNIKNVELQLESANEPSYDNS